MTVVFEHQRIRVSIGPRCARGEREPRAVEIDAIVGLQTGMAYHLAPCGTVLFQCFPDAWMLSFVSSGSTVTRFPLPADATTAELLLVYLHEHRDEGTVDLLHQRCVAQGNGKWVPSPA